MRARPILENELVADADRITIWIANIRAPKDIWSLREAIGWALKHPDRARISLHRPSHNDRAPLWIDAEQIERLAVLIKAPGAEVSRRLL
jgi:hypothetical protein